MTVRPLDGGYRADVQWKGQRGRYRAATREEAEKAEAVMLANLKTGRPVYEGLAQRGPVKVQSPLVNLSDTIQVAYASRWAFQKDGSGSRRRAELAVELMGDPPLKGIDANTVDVLRAKLVAKGTSPSTINRYLAALSVLLEVAKVRRAITSVPDLEYLDEDEGRIRQITRAEEGRLLALLPPPIDMLVAFAVDTGMRRGEILGWRLRDYDGRRLTLWGEQTKARNSRTIVATARVREIIAYRREVDKVDDVLFGDLPPWMVRNAWERARKAMGLTDDPDFVFHACRHTCASRLVKAKINLRVVQTWMGHKNITTTLRYAHLDDDQIAEAAEQLSRFCLTARDAKPGRGTRNGTSLDPAVST